MPISTNLLKSFQSKETTERLTEAKEIQAKYYNKRAKSRQRLTEGQTVRVKLDDKHSWDKATVDPVLPYRSYIIKTADGSNYRRNSKHVRFSDEPPCIIETDTTGIESIPLKILPPVSSDKQVDYKHINRPTNINQPISSFELTKQQTGSDKQQFQTRSGRIINKPARFRE
jgi:hypothetical protein